MGVLEWIVGLGVDKGLLRNPAKSINASEDEECRVNMRCGFIDGISQEEFESIVIQIGNRFRRLSDVSVDGPLVNGTVYSQSGLSEWNFTIDFNDYGHLTGRYWLFTDNDDSNIPSYIANAISAAISDTLSNKTNENMIETNAYKRRIHLKKSLDLSNSDFDSNKKGSIIFLVGLAMPHYRLLIPSASLDMNLRQCFRVITPTATNSGTACFLTPRRAQAS